MPVLGDDYMLVVRDELVDQRHDFFALRHRERAAGTEVVLHVCHQQSLM